MQMALFEAGNAVRSTMCSSLQHNSAVIRIKAGREPAMLLTVGTPCAREDYHIEQ